MTRAPATKADLRLMRSLATPEARRRTGLIMVEGATLIRDALNSGLRPALVLSAPSALAKDEDSADAFESVSQAGAKAITAELSSVLNVSDARTPRPIVAAFEFRLPADFTHDFAGIKTAVVLSDVQDPGNVGACIRVAEAAGIDAVFASPSSADPLGPKAVRGSAGSIFRQRVVACEITEALRRFESAGITTWAAVAIGGTDYRDAAFAPSAAVVLGNEGRGLDSSLIARCDRSVSIPLRGRVESLNVATACALLAFRLTGG